MVDIPLSKGWVSTITTILLSPIMAGFLNALGADVYQASKTMAFDTQAPYSGYPYGEYSHRSKRYADSY